MLNSGILLCSKHLTYVATTFKNNAHRPYQAYASDAFDVNFTLTCLSMTDKFHCQQNGRYVNKYHQHVMIKEKITQFCTRMFGGRFRWWRLCSVIIANCHWWSERVDAECEFLVSWKHEEMPGVWSESRYACSNKSSCGCVCVLLSSSYRHTTSSAMTSSSHQRCVQWTNYVNL